MMFYAVLISFIIIFIFLIYYLFKRPLRKISELDMAINILLKRGFNGGTLIVDHPKTKTFVQFRKYIHKNGVYGIEAAFPNISWSKEFFSSVKSYVLKNNLIIGDPTWSSADRDFLLVIDFVKDSDGAYRFLRAVFLDIVGASEKDGFYVSLDGVKVKDVLVDC